MRCLVAVVACIVDVGACLVDVGADAVVSCDVYDVVVADSDEAVVFFSVAASSAVVDSIVDSENVVSGAVGTAVDYSVVYVIWVDRLPRSAHDSGKCLPLLPTERCYRVVEAWNASWAEPLGIHFPAAWWWLLILNVGFKSSGLIRKLLLLAWPTGLPRTF